MSLYIVWLYFLEFPSRTLSTSHIIYEFYIFTDIKIFCWKCSFKSFANYALSSEIAFSCAVKQVQSEIEENVLTPKCMQHFTAYLNHFIRNCSSFCWAPTRIPFSHYSERLKSFRGANAGFFRTFSSSFVVCIPFKRFLYFFPLIYLFSLIQVECILLNFLPFILTPHLFWHWHDNV